MMIALFIDISGHSTGLGIPAQVLGWTYVVMAVGSMACFAYAMKSYRN